MRGGWSGSMSQTPKSLSPVALVSGGSGFAGRHLVDFLRAGKNGVIAPTRAELDFRDGAAVRQLVAGVEPATIFHLAAFSSPSRSIDQPGEALLGNLEMSLNVLEAVRRMSPETVVVLIGSSQIYGEPESQPLTEDSPFDPGNPYAVSKASGDLLGRQYADCHGLHVLRMRPFNHAGPGQSEQYVISSLARQVAEAESTESAECVLRTGSPDVARDFTDVRDVVRAYSAAAGVSSGAFNVCRGSAISISELVEIVASCSRVPVRHQVEEARRRKGESALVYGSPDRLFAATGWRQEIPLEKTVTDTVEWWRNELR